MPQGQDPNYEYRITKAHGLFVASSVALIGLGIGGAWLVSLEAPSDLRIADRFLAFLISPWMIFTEVATAGFLVFGLWYLRSSAIDDAETSNLDAVIKQRGRLLGLIFVVFGIVLSSIGYLFIDDLGATFRAQRFAQQDAIARLKAQQVDKWLLERSVDVELLGVSLRPLPLDRLATDRDARRFIEVLFAEIMARNIDWAAVSLFAPNGSVLMNVGVPSERTKELAGHFEQPPQADSKLRITDVSVVAGSSHQLNMDFILPVVQDDRGPTAAFIVVSLDPGRQFFNQIGDWPTDSPSSEVLLLRREGDKLTFLTSPRLLNKVPEPLSLRLPLSQTSLPGAQAILRGDGVREGVDYRGVKVLSASRHVRGLPWFVVAKTDSSEALAPMRQRSQLIVLVIGTVILVAALIVVVLWRGQRASYLAFRDRQVEEHDAMAKQFEELVSMTRDIVMLVGPQGNIVEANEAAATAYGYSLGELRNLKVADLQQQDTVEGDRRLTEAVHRRKDGTSFPVEIMGRALDIKGKRYRQRFVRDISRRKELEHELRRMKRVQKALLAANGILLRARSETELFQRMCEAIVSVGGYRMANVAIPNRDGSKTFTHAAIAGVDDGYLSHAHITWDDGPSGRSPAGMAMKTGAIQVSQNFTTDQDTAPWREAALSRGYRASISLPLRTSGKVFGVLTLYATQCDAFDAEEVSLLSDFADDISFGVTSLRAGASVEPK